MVSGWPYQLNLSDGSLVDLNSSNLNTTNFTIYIIHITQNNTILTSPNYTNYTYTNYNYTYINSTITQNITQTTILQNLTCVNCSYFYNNTGYNKSEEDGRFILLTDFNSYKNGLTYPSRSEFDSLNTKVVNISLAETPVEVNTSFLSVGLIVVGLFSLIALFLAIRAGGAQP